MSDAPNNPHAFPLGAAKYSIQSGMTLRDWFAGQAMSQTFVPVGYPIGEEVAKVAYEIADAMLAEREQNND